MIRLQLTFALAHSPQAAGLPASTVTNVTPLAPSTSRPITETASPPASTATGRCHSAPVSRERRPARPASAAKSASAPPAPGSAPPLRPPPCASNSTWPSNFSPPGTETGSAVSRQREIGHSGTETWVVVSGQREIGHSGTETGSAVSGQRKIGHSGTETGLRCPGCGKSATRARKRGLRCPGSGKSATRARKRGLRCPGSGKSATRARKRGLRCPGSGKLGRRARKPTNGVRAAEKRAVGHGNDMFGVSVLIKLCNGH